MKKLIALLLVLVSFVAVAEEVSYVATKKGQDESGYYVYEITLTADDRGKIFDNLASVSWHKSYKGDPYVTKQVPGANYGKEFYWSNCIIQCKRKVKNDGKYELKSAGFYVDYKTKSALQKKLVAARGSVTVTIHIAAGSDEVAYFEVNGVKLKV